MFSVKLNELHFLFCYRVTIICFFFMFFLFFLCFYLFIFFQVLEEGGEIIPSGPDPSRPQNHKKPNEAL